MHGEIGSRGGRRNSITQCLFLVSKRWLLPTTRILALNPSEVTSILTTPSGNVHVFVFSTGLKYKLYPVKVLFPPLDKSCVSDAHVSPKKIAVVFGKWAKLEGFEGQATSCGSTMTDEYSIPVEYVLLRPSLNALCIPTNCLFRRYHSVRYGKDECYTCTLEKPLVFLKHSKIKDWKDQFFFLWDPYASLKSSWTIRKRLTNLPVKLDVELQCYREIIYRYPTQLRIRENWSMALLETCGFYGGVFDRTVLRGRTVLAILGEDPSLWVNEKVDEEKEILPIRGGPRCGSDPYPELVFPCSATPRSPNPHVASNAHTLQRDTTSNSSKKSHSLGVDCYAVRRIDKGKFVLLPFKEGPTPHVDDPFSNTYPVSELETGEEEILFWPNWDLDMNDCSIDPPVCVEMLDQLVHPRNIMFASQISSPELMKYFLTAFDAVVLFFDHVLCLSFETMCQLAELSRDAKERELADIGKKEQNLQKALLECTGLEWLLGVVINREGHLNPHLVRDICEMFIQTTHMRTLFNHWMLIVVQKVIQDFVVDIQKVAQWYQVDADTARVVQAPAPLFKQPWSSD
ncbi:hypothetical protein M9H77_22297 [Catharanthus roseus]|uniref:Uncharacterized protein n=1 Tax=Catharanthus roseus TaxID=4058 RepID=A0ACC0AR03_CATRO|nr:hypothetical protein M9H77_22297 [Catharanthus roseus]